MDNEALNRINDFLHTISKARLNQFLKVDVAICDQLSFCFMWTQISAT